MEYIFCYGERSNIIEWKLNFHGWISVMIKFNFPLIRATRNTKLFSVGIDFFLRGFSREVFYCTDSAHECGENLGVPIELSFNLINELLKEHNIYIVQIVDGFLVNVIKFWISFMLSNTNHTTAALVEKN